MIALRTSYDIPARDFLQHKSKMIGDCCVFQFSPLSVDGKYLMGFQSETSPFEILKFRASVWQGLSVTGPQCDRASVYAVKWNFGLRVFSAGSAWKFHTFVVGVTLPNCQTEFSNHSITWKHQNSPGTSCEFFFMLIKFFLFSSDMRRPRDLESKWTHHDKK